MKYKIITLLAVSCVAALTFPEGAYAQRRLENGVVKAWNGRSFQPLRHYIPTNTNQINGLGYATLVDPANSRSHVRLGRYDSRTAALRQLRQFYPNHQIYRSVYLPPNVRSGIRSSSTGIAGAIPHPGYSPPNYRYIGNHRGTGTGYHRSQGNRYSNGGGKTVREISAHR